MSKPKLLDQVREIIRLKHFSIRTEETYKGKRIKRGLFRSSTGKLLNANVNGSVNILTQVAT